MAVDLNKVDLTRPDPNYKSDPAKRGDIIDSSDDTEVLEEENEEEDVVVEDVKKPDKKKKAAKPAKEESEEEEEPEEEEESEEEEEESEEEEEPEEEPEDKKKDKKDPNKRIQQAIAQRNTAQEKLAALTEKLEALERDRPDGKKKELEKAQERIEELYEAVEKARATGDYKESAKLQRELDGLRTNMSRAETLILSRREAIAQQQNQIFNSTLSQLETVFPQLVEDSDDFDQELLTDMDETIRGYEAIGMSAPDALRKASRRLLKYDPFLRGDKAYLDGKPEEKKDEKPTKKKTDIKKNIEAAKKQPPDGKDTTVDIQSKLDMNKLPPDEYAKLPAEVRARLRGDKLSR